MPAGRPQELKEGKIKAIYLEQEQIDYYQALANKTGKSFSEVCRDQLARGMK